VKGDLARFSSHHVRSKLSDLLGLDMAERALAQVRTETGADNATVHEACQRIYAKHGKQATYAILKDAVLEVMKEWYHAQR
jgi:signal transduction histidine kinase